MEDIGLFVIDLSECTNTGEIINNVSLALEIPNASGRGISLKLKDNVLNQSQILSIKSLIESYNSQLVNVETTSLITQNACETMGIKVTRAKVMKLKKSANADVMENERIQPDIEKTSEINQNITPPDKEEEVENRAPVQGLAEGLVLGPETVVTTMVTNKFDELKTELPDEAIAQPVKPQKTQKDLFKKQAKAQHTAPANPATVEKPVEKPFEEEFEGLQKQTITVYKKASDENLQDESDFEEVDFYAPPTDEPVVIDNKQTIYVNQTLRSGQTLEFDGNIVIIGDCHPGSEIKATGDITVWGVLGSIAHAGCSGNREAKIRALKMNAVQLRIANCYSRRPDGGNIPYIVKSAIFTPEEARIVEDNIVLFKMANQ